MIDPEERTRQLEDAFAEAYRLFNEQRIGLTMPEAEALASRLFGEKLNERERLANERRERLGAAIDAWIEAGGDRAEAWARARACCDSPVAYEVLIKALDRECGKAQAERAT